MRDLTARIPRDVLSDVLASVRFRGTLLCRSELRAPWGFTVVGRDFATFHIALKGGGCVDVHGVDERLRLAEGDLVILPQGNAHTVRDAPSSPATRLEQLIADGSVDVRGVLTNRGSGAPTRLVCGAFHFEDRSTNPVLSSLPPVIHLRGKSRGVARIIRTTLTFLRQESDAARPGADLVVTRLAEILFVEALRAHLDSPEAERSGLAVALRDRRIGKSLAAIHRGSNEQWSLDRLAKLAGMSRTAYAMRFHELVGESPGRYTTRLRMEQAAALLRSSDAPLIQVAERVGYDSELGFSRAFKRIVGASPAVFRRRSRRALTARG